MRQFSIFFDSFLDGFTMSGFLNRLQRPGQATRMFSPARPVSASAWQPLTFEPASAPSHEVELAGDLSRVPEQALHAMVEILTKEEESRKAIPALKKAMHGVSR